MWARPLPSSRSATIGSFTEFAVHSSATDSNDKGRTLMRVGVASTSAGTRNCAVFPESVLTARNTGSCLYSVVSTEPKRVGLRSMLIATGVVARGTETHNPGLYSATDNGWYTNLKGTGRGVSRRESSFRICGTKLANSVFQTAGTSKRGFRPSTLLNSKIMLSNEGVEARILCALIRSR